MDYGREPMRGPDQTVRRPLGPDLARILLIDLLFGGGFALIFGIVLGWSVVAADWIAWPVALGLTALVELIFGFPTHVARSVSLTKSGFEIRRTRRGESYPWAALELSAGSHWHPLYGREFLATITRPADRLRIGVGLTPAQNSVLRREMAKR